MAGKPGSGGKPGLSGRKPGPASLAKIELDCKPPLRITAPANLSPPAKREYRRVVKLLVDRQHWREDFRGPMAVYAQAYMDWTTARENLDAFGILVRSAKGEPMENPWLAIADRAEARMLRVAVQMGLTLVGLSRTLRQHSRERYIEKDGQRAGEIEKWDEDLLA